MISETSSGNAIARVGDATFHDVAPDVRKTHLLIPAALKAFKLSSSRIAPDQNQRSTTEQFQNDLAFRPEARLVRLRVPGSDKLPKLKVLQRWIGYVSRVSEDRFTAIVEDETVTRNPAEEIEFNLDEVSDDDRALLAEGAVFYWSIGYRETPGGQRTRSSLIRFARRPRISDAHMKRLFDEAERSAHLFSHG